MEKAREFQKNIYFCFIDYAQAFDCVNQDKLWKIPQELGVPDHLTCLLRNLYAGQEVTVRTRHGRTDWFFSKLGKEYDKAVYCHPAYLPLCRLELLCRVRLCDPMDCSLPGSSLHGIFQAIVLEWVSFSRGSSGPRDWIRVSSIVGRHFTIWTFCYITSLLWLGFLAARQVAS